MRGRETFYSPGLGPRTIRGAIVPRDQGESGHREIGTPGVGAPGWGSADHRAVAGGTNVAGGRIEKIVGRLENVFSAIERREPRKRRQRKPAGVSWRADVRENSRGEHGRDAGEMKNRRGPRGSFVEPSIEPGRRQEGCRAFWGHF